jgi:hypothetical protein
MAQFYATLHGQRGPTSRLGNKRSGLTACVKSYQGEVLVTMSHKDGIDMVTVILRPHDGAGDRTGENTILLYSGPCGAWDQMVRAKRDHVFGSLR